VSPELVSRAAAALLGSAPTLEAVRDVLSGPAVGARSCELRGDAVMVATDAGLVRVDVFGAPWPDEDEESLADLGGPAAGLHPGALARAGSQDALWPGGARAARAHGAFCHLRMVEETAPPKQQMEALERLAVALLALPDGLCVFFPAGESLRDGNIIGKIRHVSKEQGALPLQIWINGRLADAGMGVRVADVVGLTQLGMADAEAVFPDSAGLAPFEVLGFLLDVTHHLAAEGGALEDGVIYEGPGGLRWRAGLGADAQIPPARKIVRWIPVKEGEA